MADDIRSAEAQNKTRVATADSAEERTLADADLNAVVRGVGVAAAPKAKRVRPLAGLIVIGLVVLAVGYMQHGLKNRRMKKTVPADSPHAAAGPATVSEKSWMSDQARLGVDTGSAHVPASMRPRTSIADGTADGFAAAHAESPGPGRSSIPPLQYTQTPISTAANGALSFAEERRLELYKQEQEAIESGTSIRGASNTYPQEGTSTQQPATTDPMQAIQASLLRQGLIRPAPPSRRKWLPGLRGNPIKTSAILIDRMANPIRRASPERRIRGIRVITSRTREPPRSESSK